MTTYQELIQRGVAVSGPFAGPTIVQTAPVQTQVSPTSTACDPRLTVQYSTLLRNVIIEVFQASQAISGKNVPQNAALFSKLADDTRALGDVEGKIAACAPTTKSAASLGKLVSTNLQSLALTEARLTQAWLNHDYSTWMALRKQLETYHKAVAQYRGWLDRVSAQMSANPIPGTLPGFQLPSTNLSPPQLMPPGTVPGSGGGAVVTTPPDVTAIVQPFYKRAWFWGAVGVAGVTLFTIARR